MLQIFALCFLIIGVSFMFYFRNLSPFIYHCLVCIIRVGDCILSRTQRQTQRKTTKALKIGDKKNLSIVLNQGKKSLLK